MDIDIERLKVDESLWPEGKWYWCGRPWVRGFHSDHEPCSECIPRPTNPEWVDGLPPVGRLVEGFINYGASTKWRKCEVLKHANGEAAVYAENRFLAWCKEFRPIQTPEQRRREELALTAWSCVGGGKAWAFNVADAIIAAGWRKGVS